MVDKRVPGAWVRGMPASATLWTLLASLLTFAAFAPYIRGIVAGGLRPHVFSWLIWGVTTTVVFVAQLRAGGGIGSWATGLSAVITFLIAGLALARRGDRSVTRLDWVFLAGALSSLPLWWLTDDPTWAVAVLTLVDVLGFGPTLRVAWQRPHTESPLFYGMFTLRNAAAVPALETFSVATLLFPVVVGAACAGVVVLLLVRRRALGRPATEA